MSPWYNNDMTQIRFSDNKSVAARHKLSMSYLDFNYIQTEQPSVWVSVCVFFSSVCVCVCVSERERERERERGRWTAGSLKAN